MWLLESEVYCGVSDGGSEVGLFVLVETDSSILPCPPYSTGVEIPCTICSKLSNC